MDALEPSIGLEIVQSSSLQRCTRGFAGQGAPSLAEQLWGRKTHPRPCHEGPHTEKGEVARTSPRPPTAPMGGDHPLGWIMVGPPNRRISCQNETDGGVRARSQPAIAPKSIGTQLTGGLEKRPTARETRNSSAQKPGGMTRCWCRWQRSDRVLASARAAVRCLWWSVVCGVVAGGGWNLRVVFVREDGRVAPGKHTQTYTNKQTNGQASQGSQGRFRLRYPSRRRA